MSYNHSPPLREDFLKTGFDSGLKAPLYKSFYMLRGAFGNIGADFPFLDLSYLPSLVIDHAGIDGGEYFRVSSAMRDLCEGRFADCRADENLVRSYFTYLAANIASKPMDHRGK